MTTTLWTPEVVAAVARHMNDDHGEDNVRIVRALGGTPAAVSARMTGMDAEGLVFEVVEVNDGEVSDGEVNDSELNDGAVDDGVRVTVQTRVAWLTVPTDRAQVRVEVVALHDAAVAAGT